MEEMLEKEILLSEDKDSDEGMTFIGYHNFKMNNLIKQLDDLNLFIINSLRLYISDRLSFQKKKKMV